MENMWTWEGVHSRSWLERPIKALWNIADQLLHHSDLVKNQLVASLPKHAWSRTPDANFHYARLPSRPACSMVRTKEGMAGTGRQCEWLASGDATTVLMFLLRHWRLIASVRPSTQGQTRPSSRLRPTRRASTLNRLRIEIFPRVGYLKFSRLRNGCGG